jgi:hypothetical protein
MYLLTGSFEYAFPLGNIICWSFIKPVQRCTWAYPSTSHPSVSAQARAFLLSFRHQMVARCGAYRGVPA